MSSEITFECSDRAESATDQRSPDDTRGIPQFVFDDGRFQTIAENESGDFFDAFGVELVDIGESASEHHHVWIQNVDQVGHRPAKVAKEGVHKREVRRFAFAVVVDDVRGG